MATAPGERVISAAAQGFGAMFSHMCPFCSGDLPVPPLTFSKRERFQNNTEASEGSGQEGEGQGHLWQSGVCWWHTRLFWKVLLYLVLASSPGWWLVAISSACFPRLGLCSYLVVLSAQKEESKASSRSQQGLSYTSALSLSSCIGRKSGLRFTLFRVFLEPLDH